MSRVLQIRNRQRRWRIDTRKLKSLLIELLAGELGVTTFEIGIHLVGAAEMARVNETFLQHEGSTDVITFSHRASPSPTDLHGEIYVCVDEAVTLAPRFRSTWQAEIVRYAVHGCLHLQGHDDLEPAARRTMKRVENRLMRSLRKRFAPAEIGHKVTSAT
jgi:probable rRNA maturation factor